MALTLHKVDLHTIQLGKYCAGISGLMALVFWLVVGVTATVPPPSKEGKSPSNLVLLARIFLSMNGGQDL